MDGKNRAWFSAGLQSPRADPRVSRPRTRSRVRTSGTGTGTGTGTRCYPGEALFEPRRRIRWRWPRGGDGDRDGNSRRSAGPALVVVMMLGLGVVPVPDPSKRPGLPELTTAWNRDRPRRRPPRALGCGQGPLCVPCALCSSPIPGRLIPLDASFLRESRLGFDSPMLQKRPGVFQELWSPAPAPAPLLPSSPPLLVRLPFRRGGCRTMPSRSSRHTMNGHGAGSGEVRRKVATQVARRTFRRDSSTSRHRGVTR